MKILSQGKARGSATITAITKASQAVVTVTDDQYVSGINDYVLINGLSGDAEYEALNGTRHRIADIDRVTDQVTLDLDTSGFTSAYSGGGSLSTQYSQIRVKSIGVDSITAATNGVVVFDDVHQLRPGDIIEFSGLSTMTELNGKKCSVLLVINNTSIQLNENTSTYAAETTGSSGVASLPYGAMLPMTSVDDSTFDDYDVVFATIDSAYANLCELLLHVCLDTLGLNARNNASTHVTAYIWGCKYHVNKNTQYGVTQRQLIDSFQVSVNNALSLDFGLLFFTKNIGIYPDQVYYLDGYGVSIKFESEGDDNVETVGVENTTIYAPHITDDEARVDVGLVLGSTPDTKTEIATETAAAVLTTPANKLGTDTSGRVTLAPTGLDAISATTPTALGTTLATKMLQVWAAMFGRVKRNGSTLEYYDEGDNLIMTRSISSDKSLTGYEDVAAAVNE